MTLLVLNDVGSVVDNNIEEDLDAALMGRINQTFKIIISTEMGINLGEIYYPIAMVGVAVLSGTVTQYWGHPDGGNTHSLKVVQLFFDALDIASVEARLHLRKKATL